MAIQKPSSKGTEVQIMEVDQGVIECCILGQSPLICNAMSQKVTHELLLPAAKKNAAARASNLKHNPQEEFRASMYKDKGDGPTRVIIPATAFKGALMSAALDIPGSSKAQIGRLAYVASDYVPIYGIPQIMMSVTRCADIKRTPDVRTRAIIPHWACFLTIKYVKPILKDQAIMNLLSAAGITQGIGDWRVQKGSGNYGQFALVGIDDKGFRSVIENGAREAQDEAIENPETYDSETDELFSWFKAEVKRRGFKEVA